MASPLRAAPPANRIPRRRRKPDFTPPPCLAPQPHAEDPLPVPQPIRPGRGRQAEAPPTPGGQEGDGRREHSAQGRSRPFLHNRTRAPTPPLSGGTRARPLRAHRDYALLPLPHRPTLLRLPPPPLPAPHIATHLPPGGSTGSRGQPPPRKNTHPRVPRYSPPGSPPRPRPSVLSPQSCFGRSLLRVPLGVSLRLSREAPRTARNIGPPKRTGSLLSAKEAVTGFGAQTGKEGGREGNSEGGRGGGEDGETVSAASTAAAASLLPGKSRPLRRPAPQRKDSTSLRHRLHYPPVKGLANRLPCRPTARPFPSAGWGGVAAHLLHAPIGGERP